MPPLIRLHSFYYDDQHREYKPREVYVNPNHIVSVEPMKKHPGAPTSADKMPVSLVCLTTSSFIVRELPDEIYSIMEAHG